MKESDRLKREIAECKETVKDMRPDSDDAAFIAGALVGVCASMLEIALQLALTREAREE